MESYSDKFMCEIQQSGCCDGNGYVKLYDPTNDYFYYKKVSSVQKDDKIYNPKTNKKYNTVECVIKVKVSKPIKLTSINGLFLTPYHPILYENKWKFPKDIASTMIKDIEYLYNFVLDSGHIVTINDIEILTLGHGFTFNDVVRHEYFGSAIINDLRKYIGWYSGLININIP